MADKNTEELSKQITRLESSVKAMTGSFKDGSSKIKEGFSDLGAGGGPLSILVDELKGVTKKFQAIGKIFSGTFEVITSPGSAFAEALGFGSKEEREQKKRDQNQEDNTKATKENTKELKKFNKRGILGTGVGGGRNSGAAIAGDIGGGLIRGLGSILAPTLIGAGIVLGLKKWWEGGPKDELVKDLTGGNTPWWEKLQFWKGRLRVNDESEILKDLERTSGFSSGLNLNQSQQDRLKAQGKIFSKYAEYFTPVAAGVTEQTLKDYITKGYSNIKDVKSFISGPRKLREISPGVYVDAEIYDNTGKQVVFKDIKSNEGGNINEFTNKNGQVDYTGNRPRNGGVDGKGGMLELIHPNELIIDLSKPVDYDLFGNILVTTKSGQKRALTRDEYAQQLTQQGGVGLARMLGAYNTGPIFVDGDSVLGYASYFNQELSSIDSGGFGGAKSFLIGDEDQFASGIAFTKSIDLLKSTGIRNVSMLTPDMITKQGTFNQKFNAPGMKTTNMKGPFSIFGGFGSYNTNLDLVNKNKFRGLSAFEDAAKSGIIKPGQVVPGQYKNLIGLNNSRIGDRIMGMKKFGKLSYLNPLANVAATSMIIMDSYSDYNSRMDAIDRFEAVEAFGPATTGIYDELRTIITIKSIEDGSQDAIRLFASQAALGAGVRMGVQQSGRVLARNTIKSAPIYAAAGATAMYSGGTSLAVALVQGGKDLFVSALAGIAAGTAAYFAVQKLMNIITQFDLVTSIYMIAAYRGDEYNALKQAIAESQILSSSQEIQEFMKHVENIRGSNQTNYSNPRYFLSQPIISPDAQGSDKIGNILGRVNKGGFGTVSAAQLAMNLGIPEEYLIYDESGQFYYVGPGIDVTATPRTSILQSGNKGPVLLHPDMTVDYLKRHYGIEFQSGNAPPNFIRNLTDSLFGIVPGYDYEKNRVQDIGMINGSRPIINVEGNQDSVFIDMPDDTSDKELSSSRQDNSGRE